MRAVDRRRWAAAAAVLALLAGLLLAAGPAATLSRPGPPRSVAALPGNGLVTVTWAAPAISGGARIDRYEVQRWRTGTTRRTPVRVGASVRRVVIRSLVNGVRYSFAVRAHNRAGWGRLSATRSATPRTLPGEPGSVAATPDKASMHLTWLAPASTGGASVDHYGLRVESAGDPFWTPATTDSGTDQVTGLSTTVHGLRDATGNPYDIHPYRVEVRAHNAAGWGPWAQARLAPGAIRQAPPLVVNATVHNPDGSVAGSGAEAAQSFAEWFRGSDAVTVSLPPPDCSTAYQVGCAGGSPQSPAATLALDTVQQPGDLARTQVSLVSGQPTYDVTLRARVTTSGPVDYSFSGTPCTIAVDSRSGTSADWVFQLQVTFTGSGWQEQPSGSTASVNGTEPADYTIGGSFLCSSVDPSSAIAAFRQQALDGFQQYVGDLLADTCGADAPTYWEHCYPILENVPDPPAAVAAVPGCPTAPPPAGPYLTTSCSSAGALVKTCAAGWKDADGALADGCEQRVSGVVPMEIDATTAQALADHLAGSFSLDGYPGGVGAGATYLAPPPRAALPLCATGTAFGCPHAEQQQPMPQLVLDLVGGSAAWSVSAEGVVTVTLYPRLRTTGDVTFLHGGVGCQVGIDNAQATLSVAVTGSGTGPPTISGGATFQGITGDQVVLGPTVWCQLWAGIAGVSDIEQWLSDALVAWAQSRASSLCGAPAPYYWQGCS